MKEPGDIVSEATGYPFVRPAYSFLFVDGAVEPLQRVDQEELDARLHALGQAPLAARMPVLAYGANAAPERLRLKFAPLSPGVAIPVLEARLFGFDIVHACHFSSYGAIPATLQASPGTIAAVAVTWLDERELARMTETETINRNYAYGTLHDIRLEVAGLGRRKTVASYWTRRGCLRLGDGPVALAAIAAERRRFEARAKSDVVAAVRDLLAPGMPLDRFIVETVRDRELRSARSRALADHAVPFAWAARTEISRG